MLTAHLPLSYMVGRLVPKIVPAATPVLLTVSVLPVLACLGYLATGLAFFGMIGVHLVQDSTGDGITWGVPFDDRPYAQARVPDDTGLRGASFTFCRTRDWA